MQFVPKREAQLCYKADPAAYELVKGLDPLSVTLPVDRQPQPELVERKKK